MTRIKICGITNIEDAAFAVSLGVDALGFVFYKGSPRYVPEDVAREIIRQLPPFLCLVGVFVNEDEDRVKEISEFCSLDLLQFHGNESPEYCSRFSRRLIKAFRIKDRECLEALPSYEVSAVLLDTHYDDRYGGGGKTFNWQLASEAKRYCNRVVVAGGLTPRNVPEAIQTASPYGVDVSSGVESLPGRKDHAKLEEFVSIVRTGSSSGLSCQQGKGYVT